MVNWLYSWIYTRDELLGIAGIPGTSATFWLRGVAASGYQCIVYTQASCFDVLQYWCIDYLKLFDWWLLCSCFTVVVGFVYVIYCHLFNCDDVFAELVCYFAPCSTAKYCDGHICLSVTMSISLELYIRSSPNLPCMLPIGKKLCRYNLYSAGSLGWPFPVLKYKYIFQIKCTEAISSKFIQQHSEAVMVWNYQNADSIKIKLSNIECSVIYNIKHI